MTSRVGKPLSILRVGRILNLSQSKVPSILKEHSNATLITWIMNFKIFAIFVAFALASIASVISGKIEVITVLATIHIYYIYWKKIMI